MLPPAPPPGGEPAPDERPDPAREPRSDDDPDLGWGDDLDRTDRGDRDARWYEEQRPPHWE